MLHTRLSFNSEDLVYILSLKNLDGNFFVLKEKISQILALA